MVSFLICIYSSGPEYASPVNNWSNQEDDSTNIFNALHEARGVTLDQPYRYVKNDNRVQTGKSLKHDKV